MSITPFTFNGSEVRTILRDGEPWFVAADVCAVLSIANVSLALAKQSAAHFRSLLSAWSHVCGMAA